MLATRQWLRFIFRLTNSTSEEGLSNVSESEIIPSMRHGKAAFAFIFVTVLLDMLALGVMIPVLPKLIVEFEGGNMANGAQMAGIFGFVWAAMQFFFSPVLGSLSDRFGRRPVVLLSNFGLGLDYIFMALAPSLPWLLVGRVISGITASSYPTACAYITDITPPENRAARFGMLGAAFGLGFILGPAAGGLLAGISLRFPFYVAAALSLLNAAYGFFILPESLAPEQRAKSLQWKSVHPLGALTFLGKAGVLNLALIVFLHLLAHESLPSVFVLYSDFRYGWTEVQVGAVLAAVGMCSTIVSAFVVGPAVKRLGERVALLSGLCFGILGFFVYGIAPTGALFLAGLPFIALWALSGPSAQSLMTRRVGPTEQGQLQGSISSLRGISGMLGPLLFTQTFAFFIREKNVELPGAPYLLAALLLVAALLWALRVAKPA